MLKKQKQKKKQCNKKWQCIAKIKQQKNLWHAVQADMRIMTSWHKLNIRNTDNQTVFFIRKIQQFIRKGR